MADLQVDWDGRHYTLDLDSITGKEFSEIEKTTGKKPGEFLTSLFQPVADDTGKVTGVEMPSGSSINALSWLFRKRDGQPARLADIDEPYAPFLKAVLDGFTTTESEAGEAPKDPSATETASPKTDTTTDSDGAPGTS
jgi:hypothetical protein